MNAELPTFKNGEHNSESEPTIDRGLISLKTSHANIAYRKQLPPQRTVGTIGSAWQESTSSKKTTGQAKTHAKRNVMKTNSRKCQTARAAFA